MKTEPTEALKLLSETKLNPIHEIPRYRADIIARIAFSEGQSNPKIKQLEWVEVWEGYEDAKTPFGHYVVRPSIDNKTFLMIDLRKGIVPYLTLSEARSAAQADFEKRVKECLDL